MPDIQIPPIDLGVSLQLLIVFGWAMLLLLVDLFVGAGSKRIIGYLALAGVVVAAAAGIPYWGSNGCTF